MLMRWTCLPNIEIFFCFFVFFFAACGNQMMDVVLVLDVSDDAAALEAFRSFAVEFARFANLDSGLVRIGVVTYSAEVDQRVDLTRFTQTEALVRFLTSLRLQRGRRDTAGGLQAMRQLFTPERGDRPDAPNLALLLTTGNSVLRATQVRQRGLALKWVGWVGRIG